MGVFSSAAKFLSKQAERAMLLFSGMQWGDNNNDKEKVVAALASYQNMQSANEKLALKEDNAALIYIVVILVIVVVIFMAVLCMKMMLDNLRTNQRPNSIQLNTLRTANSAGSS